MPPWARPQLLRFRSLLGGPSASGTGWPPAAARFWTWTPTRLERPLVLAISICLACTCFGRGGLFARASGQVQQASVAPAPLILDLDDDVVPEAVEAIISPRRPQRQGPTAQNWFACSHVFEPSARINLSELFRAFSKCRGPLRASRPNQEIGRDRSPAGREIQTATASRGLAAIGGSLLFRLSRSGQ